MKVLVTGATGFIGSHLTERLVEEGHDVRALVLPTSPVTLLEKLGVALFYGDLRDRTAVSRAVHGCEWVFHIGGLVTLHGAPKADYFSINVEGTQHLAEEALKAGVRRFVFSSSCGVYDLRGRAPIAETSPLNPTTPYRHTKRLAEEHLRTAHRQEGLPIVTARLSGVYGPRSFNWLGLVQAVAAGSFRYIGDATNMMQLSHVTDVVEGLYLCARTPAIEGETFNITGAEAVPLKQFLEMLAEILDVQLAPRPAPAFPFRLLYRLSSHLYSRWKVSFRGPHRYDLFFAEKRFDLSKAQARLGFQPKIPLRQGLEELVAWYQAEGHL